MSKEPLVSILIPAHNAEHWVGDAIDSALAQTWRRKELIVVDDGSTDSTLRVVRARFSRGVRIIAQGNDGAAAARNVAFAASQGDYIQWLDADDLLAPDKVEAQLKARCRDVSATTLLSGAWAYFNYRTRKATFAPTPLWADLAPVEWMLRKMGQNLHMQTDNWLVSRELSELAGPWDHALWRDNDGEYFARVIRASDGVKFVPEARSYYRRAGYKSISHIGRSNRKLESLFRSINLHVEYLRSMEESERTKLASITYMRTWMAEFYPDRPDLARRLNDTIVRLGGRREEARLSWKYDWIVRLCGWELGKRAQVALPRAKTSCLIAWDRSMFHLERGLAMTRWHESGRAALGRVETLATASRETNEH
jgi:glycosyltransferase involved in cell wall biosynthesis